VRVWSWELSGPEEPPLEDHAGLVWDDEDFQWRHNQKTRLWVSDAPEGHEKAQPLPWSVLIETYGHLRSKPRAEAPLP
jgi:hypothetical protein